MSAYTDTLASVLNRPAFLNPPVPIVKALGGDMAKEMLLTSARIIPRKLLDSGYEFGYAELEAGLRHQLGRMDRVGA
jgi:NAD dependent epimerase/dehydratase family enzyme